MQPKEAALRKRTQIAKANRMMFAWVAGVSVVVGFAIIGGIFLVQMLMFNEKVLQEKSNTVSTLKANNANIEELESQIRVLDVNQALISSKANPDDQTLQVILDALPSEPNSLALGASLQERLLSGISGLSVNSLQVDPVSTDEFGGAVIDGGGEEQVANQIGFRFSVVGSSSALQEVLSNLEKSIRTIDVTSLRVETQGGEQVLSVQGRAFYEPAKTVELREKVVQ
jgi:Tfp pilus assembly protein PilN